MSDVTDGTRETGGAEPGDVARTISVVGLSISQAADELQQAAERLVLAEERAREADQRQAATEEQLAQNAATTAELLGLLQGAKDAQLEAEERAERAEAQLQALREALARAEERSERADEGLRIATERAARLEEQVRELERATERSLALDERTKELEAANERAARLEAQVAELQARIRAAETRPNVTVIVDDERTALQEAVAAEVRRPLTSILGITLALKHTDSKSPDGKEMIRQLSTHARKLDRLVGEMLDVDRIMSGTYTPNLRRTDLEALVRRVVEESPDLANRDVRIETDHVAVQVDPALTEQIVETLLANAGRRTVPGNDVAIVVSAEDGGAVIAVEDGGPDIPPDLRDAVFSASQDDAATAARARARGTTGLSLLSRLAGIHGGRCWVEDRPGGGCSFRVYLPDGTPTSERAAEDGPEARSVEPADDERAMALARAIGEPDEDGPPRA